MGIKNTVGKSQTITEYLKEIYPQSPATRLKKMLQHGAVSCNGKPVIRFNYLLNTGDIVEIDKKSPGTARHNAPFLVLYEDNDVIVVEKPAGISTSSTDNSPNVYKILSEYLKATSHNRTKANVVHRLDKEVSGALLFAKSEQAMNLIKNNWKQTRKLYYALVEGQPAQSEGTIESWLVEDKAYKVHSTRTPGEKAKFAITHYKTIKQIENHSLLEIELETGRKNQIRVHLSDIGCPIVGDRKYGATDIYSRRVRLHAFLLEFPHPFTRQPVCVKTPMPKGFLVLKEQHEVYK